MNYCSPCKIVKSPGFKVFRKLDAPVRSPLHQMLDAPQVAALQMFTLAEREQTYHLMLNSFISCNISCTTSHPYQLDRWLVALSAIFSCLDSLDLAIRPSNSLWEALSRAMCAHAHCFIVNLVSSRSTSP